MNSPGQSAADCPGFRPTRFDALKGRAAQVYRFCPPHSGGMTLARLFKAGTGECQRPHVASEAVKQSPGQAEACPTSGRKVLLRQVGHASACPVGLEHCHFFTPSSAMIEFTTAPTFRHNQPRGPAGIPSTPIEMLSFDDGRADSGSSG